MRILLRRLAAEGWAFERRVFDLTDAGVGHAVYTLSGPLRSYSLVAFAHDLPDEKRSDRVIADAWDATFALFDGIPTTDDIGRLAQNVPYQEAGRISERELSLSRANRSVRLWDHVVSCLAMGKQPDPAMIEQVGYLMRTTAVYGSGKFGAADRETIADRPEMAAPFQAEMMSVFLTRAFVRDLVQHLAYAKGGDHAVQLHPGLARRLGIGNSTGLGMAPFLLNHPVLLNNWIVAREEAIARVRSIQRATQQEIDTFLDRFARGVLLVDRWASSHPIQARKIAVLRSDLEQLRAYLDHTDLAAPDAWNTLFLWAEETLGEEAQEFIASLILEPYGDLVDGFADAMADNSQDSFVIDGAMPVATLRQLIEACFGWALTLQWDDPRHCARAWYISEEKQEPRLGDRFEEPIAAYEQPLAPARDAAAAHRMLSDWRDDQPIADFLDRHPEHRHTVRRAQISGIAPYGEIRDNTIGADVMPIDMLRAKLSFFGATHFDPRSDRWVRICMYAGAPYPEELRMWNADDWVYPQVNL